MSDGRLKYGDMVYVADYLLPWSKEKRLFIGHGTYGEFICAEEGVNRETFETESQELLSFDKAKLTLEEYFDDDD